jgi:hypothetical protein
MDSLNYVENLDFKFLKIVKQPKQVEKYNNALNRDNQTINTSFLY